MEIFLLAILLTNHPVFQDPAVIDAEVVKTYDKIDAHISDLAFLNERALIIFSHSESKILQYDLDEGSLRVLASQGQGPSEINGKFVTNFVFNDQIIYADFSRGVKAFRPGEPHRVISDELWGFGPCVPVNGYAVCVNQTYNSDISPETVNHSLLILEISDDGSWDRVGSFYDVDVIGDEKKDMAFSVFTVLLSSGKRSTFYRYPLYLYPNIQIMDMNGFEHGVIKVQHPVADNLPYSADYRREYRLKYRSGPMPLRDIDADKAGNVYSVIQNASGFKGLSRQILARQSPEGKLTGNFVFPFAVSRMAVTPDGRAVYFSDEDDNLYRADLP